MFSYLVYSFIASTPLGTPDSGELEAPQRRSRFDVVAMDIVNDDDDEEEKMDGMMRLDYSVPPPPVLLPESMFAGGLPDFSFYSYDNEWGMYYDPSTRIYQQCLPYCGSQQYMPPQPVPPVCLSCEWVSF